MVGGGDHPAEKYGFKMGGISGRRPEITKVILFQQYMNMLVSCKGMLYFRIAAGNRQNELTKR
jgi:hypothetical protein